MPSTCATPQVDVASHHFAGAGEMMSTGDKGAVMNWLKRLPVIRHVRYFWTMYRINRHYDVYVAMGLIPWGASDDYKEAARIWRGEI